VPEHFSGCIICGRRATQRLCSLGCLQEAVHERELNGLRLRRLRRTIGPSAAGAILRQRNAHLTAALLQPIPPGVNWSPVPCSTRWNGTGRWRPTAYQGHRPGAEVVPS
jgi:hypothetical protein